MLEIGKQYVFNTHGQDSEYKKYDNKVGTIIRPLKDGEEADISEVGNMYKLQFKDGTVIDVFEDELHKQTWEEVAKLFEEKQPLNNDFNNGLEEMIMSIYCVRMFTDDGIDMVVGYATTEEKAKKMIEIMEKTDGFDLYEYEYYSVFTDTLNINNEMISV